MNDLKRVTALFLITLFLASCDFEDDNGFPQVASLKVVHAAVNAPDVHVDYFGFQNGINFSSNPTLSFGNNERYTIPAGTDRDILIVDATDTTATLLTENLNFAAGEVATLFIVGQGNNPGSLLIEDNLSILSDSVMGIRFANLSVDSSPVSIAITGEANNVVSDLPYQGFSEYLEFPAQSANGAYSFEFRDGSGTVLTSFDINPLQPGNIVARRHLTLALIGLSDDGQGGNSLSVARINNY